MILNADNLRKFLDAVARGNSYASAMRALGAKSENSLLWVWLKRSTKGDPSLMVAWPDPEDAPEQFARLLGEARRIAILRAESILRADADGIERRMWGPNGAPIWRVDPLAVAMWKNAEDARDLGGLLDWPYAHDEDGARIQETQRETAAGSVRVHVARSTMGHMGFNPSNNIQADHHLHGRVMITNALGGKASDLETPRGKPSYARPDVPPSPLRADLERQLADLRERGPSNPTPSHPVHVHGRASGDVAERVAEPKRPDDVECVTVRTRRLPVR